ncbi:hypothetical protein [Agrobacterium fabrum]|uniref:hypothetical protein n=1 Tax=Agrobacterium fabrum TaxID=1176649 RepID=UPI003BA14371
MKHLLAIIASIAFAGSVAKSASASEWGCEVLLCAASSNPSWQGVASCHPPMEKLISAMKKPGFSWPLCEEGGAGSPGYDRYVECPAGWTPTNGDNASSISTEGQSRCMRVVNQCGAGHRSFNSSIGGQRQTTTDGLTRVFSEKNNCSFTEYRARPLRNDPYFFDIKTDQTSQSSRFWFSLDR